MIGPSVAGVQVWVATTPIDMRKSFDGLAEVVRSFLGHDPLSGSLFVFRNKGGHLVKILWWDRDGLAIYYKRLERGRVSFPARQRHGGRDHFGPTAAAVVGLGHRRPARELNVPSPPNLFSLFRETFYAVGTYIRAMSTDAPLTLDLATLPDDPAFLKRLLVERERHLLSERDQLIQRIREEAADQIERLQAERQAAIDAAVKAAVAAILRRYYGPRSESFDPRQLLLFGQVVEQMPLDERSIEAEAGEKLRHAARKEPSQPRQATTARWPGADRD